MHIVGVKVVEAADDIQAVVYKYVRKTLGLVNYYDTWHSTTYMYILYSVYLFMVMARRKKM